MIVPMKRVFILTQAKDAATTVESLRDLGIIHVEHERIPEGGNLDRVRNDLELLEKAIQIIRNYAVSKKVSAIKPADWRGTTEEILQINDHVEDLIQQDRQWQTLIEQLTPWGDFRSL